MKIGNKDFKYKKDALNYYKEILNSYNFGDIVNEKDKIEIIELLKIHPDYEKKFSNGIECITVDKVKYNNKAFHVVNNNSEKEAFSYIKCINGNKPPLTLFSNTCRHIVQEDIHNVKYQYFSDNSKSGQVKCQESGDLCIWKELVVDHRQPNTFSIIVDRFIEVNNIDINKIDYVEVLDGIYKFKDEELSQQFKEYHKLKANLRIVKKGKNLGRAHQARVRQQKKDLRI
jgi:hypothetical protein